LPGDGLVDDVVGQAQVVEAGGLLARLTGVVGLGGGAVQGVESATLRLSALLNEP
jgi:hypothetical protein